MVQQVVVVMIVSMTELVSKLIIQYSNISRVFILLILLFIISIYSCGHTTKSGDIKENENPKDSIESSVMDSISITVNLEAKSSVTFNIVDYSLSNYGLVFKNKNNKDTCIVKKIPKIYDNQVIQNSAVKKQNNKMDIINNYYLIDKNIKSIIFDKKDGNLHLNEKSKGVAIVSELYTSYGEGMSLNYRKNKSKIELDTLYNYYRKKYTIGDNKLKAQLNLYHYLNNIQKIDPLNIRVDSFVNTPPLLQALCYAVYLMIMLYSIHLGFWNSNSG